MDDAMKPLLADEIPLESSAPEVSVVIPVRDEEGSLEELLGRLAAVLEAAVGDAWEVWLIDDGSRDQSWPIIQGLHQRYSGHVRAIRHRRNFGKAAALAHGFSSARGKVIITMDADLQDQPEEIPRFLSCLEQEDVDMVSGWKQRRHDPWDKTLPSRAFNFVARCISGVKLHDINCGFKAYRMEVAKELKLYGEMHRFIPILAHAEGFRVGELVVRHEPRRHGHSKYGYTRMLKGALDLLTTVVLTRYLKRPAHFFGGLGLLIGAVGVGILAYLSIGWLMGFRGIGTRPLFFFGILGTLLSAQLVSFGLIAELLLHRTIRPDSSVFASERLE
jgi:dolichol-phosphate mannosyltransferase